VLSLDHPINRWSLPSSALSRPSADILSQKGLHLHYLESIVVILCKSSVPNFCLRSFVRRRSSEAAIHYRYCACYRLRDFAMVSAMRIVALLGLSVLAQAQKPAYWVRNNSTTTTSSTNPHQYSMECQSNDCLRQMRDSTIGSLVTAFCATYTATWITQTTSLPGVVVSMCTDGDGQIRPSKISSACSCAVTGPSTCQPNTVTVTFTPPIQTLIVTQKWV
jgi:hypothetical protein